MNNIAGGIFAGSANTCLKCNNQYVQTCLTGQNQVVGCYTVEYNFRVTDKRSDVEEFKKQIDYQKNSQKAKYTDSDASLNQKTNIVGPSVIGTGTGTGTNKNAPGPSTNAGAGGKLPCSQCSKPTCLNNVSVTATKKYCDNWWDTPSAKSYCCTKCPTVCST